jgi:hypothetical protein
MMEKKLQKKGSLKQMFIETKVVDGVRKVAQDMWWDGVAGRLMKSATNIDKVSVEGKSRNKVDFRGDLRSKRAIKEKFDDIKKAFQNSQVSYNEIIKKLTKLANERDVKDLKLMLTKMALRKVGNKDIRGLSDVEIANLIGKLGSVKFSVKEIGDVLKFIRAGYGSDAIAVQFIEAYLEDYAKKILSEYIES